MRKGLQAGLASALLLTSAALPAWAAVEREDIIILGPDGRHYTSYKTLRSDLAERVLYLGPDEPPADSLYIVPSDYETTKQDDGGTQLRFDSGSYAVMDTGVFDAEVSRGEDGAFVFTSWNGQTREDGHLGKWNAPGDFDSFAYTWIVPANIEILDYRANRRGDWAQRGDNLTWRGENVNDIAFTIRYRVRGASGSTPASAAQTPAPPPQSTEATPVQPMPKRQRMAIGSRNHDTAPQSSAREAVQPDKTTPPARTSAKSKAPAPAPATIPDLEFSPPNRLADQAPADTGSAPKASAQSDHAPESVRLDSVVVLTAGRPMITARGHLLLDELARNLARNTPDKVAIAGPGLEDSRDMGGSAAQAARVADYLVAHGVDEKRVHSEAGTLKSTHSPRAVKITVTPGIAMGRFSPGG